MMIRRFLLMLLACLLMAGQAASGEEVLQYFYLNACEQCTPEEDFAAEFLRLTGQSLADHQVVFHNVFHDQGRAAYDKATAGWSEKDKKLPLLIMGGKAYAGTTAIASGLKTTFGVNTQDTRSVVYFLTTPACGSCERARETVEQHPSIVPVEIGGQLTSSTVEVREINISAQPELAMALFRQYGVPDAQRTAPMILMGETFLAGEDAIAASFLSLLKDGAALNTPAIEPQSEELPILSLWGAFLAGLTAGFNPCALSMLLVMAGMLLSMKRSLVLYGTAYLIGKIAVYLLIGLWFAHLWTQYAPPWLPMTMQIITTLIGAALIIVNLLDAFHAQQEHYGRIRNQLPVFLRQGIRGLIQRSLARAGDWLWLIALALGMIVAAGEFLCAGQIYVAVLIANAQSGSVLPLLIYSAAFVLPSAAVLLAVAISKKTMAASDWLLRRMPLIKLLTALIMAAVLISIWV